MCIGQDPKPDFPPSKRAEELRLTLTYLMYAHIVVAIIKMVLGGFSVGINDFFSCLILWCGYSKCDYCQTIVYMMICMQDTFTLSVGLAFWYEKKIFFKADFKETTERMVKPAKEEPKKDAMIGDAEESERKNRGSVNIVVCMNVAFLIFYLTAIFWAYKAYKEFKGVVEDNMGADALEKQEQQNILQYGILRPDGLSAQQRADGAPEFIRMGGAAMQNQGLGGQASSGQAPAGPTQGAGPRGNIHGMAAGGNADPEQQPQGLGGMMGMGGAGPSSNASSQDKQEQPTLIPFKGEGTRLGGE